MHPPYRGLPVEKGIHDLLLLTEMANHCGMFRVAWGMKLREDDDSRVFGFDMSCTGPEMPGVMEQHEICPIMVRTIHPRSAAIE